MRKYFLAFTGILYFLSGQAQMNNAVKGGIIVGGAAAALMAKKGGQNRQGKANNAGSNDNSPAGAFNSQPLIDYPAAGLQDLSGTWTGNLSDGNTDWSFLLSLAKAGPNTYTALDSFQLLRNGNPGFHFQVGFVIKQTLTVTFNTNNGLLTYSNIHNIGQNFPAVNDQLKFVRDGDSAAMVNGNPRNPNRKIYLRRVAMNIPTQLAKNIISDASLDITDISYKSSNNNSVLKYNDHGQFSITLKNNAGKDIQGIQLLAVTAEQDNGITGFDHFKGTVGVPKNSSHTFNRPIVTNFSVPRDSVHFTLTFTYNGFTIHKLLTLPTESYFKTNSVTVPAYTTPRLQAVSGYYGYANSPYADVSKSLDLLVTGGDKMAAMWKAVFLSMGNGGYKIDEEQGYAIGKTAIHAVEEKAKNGDGEALFLMFYACQMGLEGEEARALSIGFLEKSAEAGFKPAVYDYALQFTQHKDYASAFKYLNKSYGLGVKKAAEVIGHMYERGLSVSNDNDSAIYYYKAGMAFGDPDATVWYAKLLAKGFDNTPPDINKAMSLTTAAAAKNCTDAMIFNGEIYSDGKQGVARSIPSAIKWFKAGADQGDRQAMLALGETYLSDAPGVVKDERSALFWIKKSAELGSPRAMLILAGFYYQGTVGEKNMILARYWYNQAVIGGYAQADATGLNAGAESFMNFWKYADFSPSYIYVNEYGHKVADGDDGLMNGFISGMFGAMSAYYGNHQELINGLEYVGKKNGFKIYGGTVSSQLVSNLTLRQGQIINIKAYGVISTGMFSGPANADGLGPNWPEYRRVKDIPCSAVMGAVKGGNWTFIGQHAFYTSPMDGPLVLALNAIDYANYKGYFDLVIQVPEN